MKSNVILSNGRVVAHRPYLSAGKPNGAIEAFMLDGEEMSNSEWVEYCKLTTPTPKKKLNWSEIKQLKAA